MFPRKMLYDTWSVNSTTFYILAKALDRRDFITWGHAERLQEMVVKMARLMGLPDRSVAILRLFAQFHDIGKVGIPESILFKPGPLTPEEAVEIRRHCEIGYRIAKSAQELAPIADKILKHHEWWNGQGYPLGLKAEEIPLECRILSIADAYDAMTNDRPYRQAISHQSAVEELQRCACTQFDPQMVSVFKRLFQKDGAHGC